MSDEIPQTRSERMAMHQKRLREEEAARQRQPEVVEVAASELQLGDRIKFPNGRKAQAITSIVDKPDNFGQMVRVLGAEDTLWVVRPEETIRKEIVE